MKPTTAKPISQLQATGLLKGKSKAICIAALALLNGVSCADAGELYPSIVVENIEITDTGEYVTLINDINELMRTKHKVSLFLRGYESWTFGGEKEETFQLSPAASFADLAQHEQSFSTDPAISDLRTRLGSMTQSLNRLYLKAIRFDGTNSPGWLINTFVDSSDESILLKKIIQLESLFLRHGINTAKINAFRSITGHSQLTHLVSINLDSMNQIGEVLDILALESWNWEYSGQPYQNCTVIKSGVYREISTE